MNANPNFTAGPDTNELPLTIRIRIQSLLRQKTLAPRQTGTLYALMERRYGMVKIGWTSAENYQDRIREIISLQKVKITDRRLVVEVPKELGSMLEKLVHTDLARYRYNLNVPDLNSSRGHRIHKEWFNIDLATAERTMQMWWSIMKHFDIRPGHEPSDDLKQVLESSHVFRSELSEVTTGACEHEATLDIWEQLLLSKPASTGNTIGRRRADVTPVIDLSNDDDGEMDHETTRPMSSNMFEPSLETDSSSDSMLTTWLIGYGVALFLPEILEVIARGVSVICR